MKTDREKLIELIEFGLAEWWEEHKKTYDHEDENEIPSIVDYLISKGVTIPVRCGECEYRTSKGECRRLGHPMLTPQDDFYCKCGERK